MEPLEQAGSRYAELMRLADLDHLPGAPEAGTSVLRELTLAHQATTALCLLTVVTYLVSHPAARAQERAVRDVTRPASVACFATPLLSLIQSLHPPHKKRNHSACSKTYGRKQMEACGPEPSSFILRAFRSRPRTGFAQQAPGPDGPAGSELM